MSDGNKEVSALARKPAHACAPVFAGQKAQKFENLFFEGSSNFTAGKNFEELSLEADDCSSDSDCCFYEIDSHGTLMMHLDIDLKEKENSIRSIFSEIPNATCSTGMDRRQYRAWIGSKSLHVARYLI